MILYWGCSPVFHDLDEVLASSQAPWYVKETDKPMVEVDWNMMTRFNCYEVMWAGGFQKVWGQEKAECFTKLSTANTKNWRKENKPSPSVNLG